MDRKFKNEVRSLSELNKSSLQFDLTDGASESHALYFFFLDSLKDPARISFQCSCGNLGIVPADAVASSSDSRLIEDGNLKCRKCGSYELTLSAPSGVSPMILAGLADLKRMFSKAIRDNYFTLCYYFWASLLSFQPRFNEVNAVCDHIVDITIRNVLMTKLSVDGIGQIRVDPKSMRTEEVILHLLLINHVFEVAELPDILLTILHIAESKHFLVGDDGVSIHGVGLRYEFEDGERDAAKKRIVLVRREIHAAGYRKLSKMIQKALNPEIRNAFSHSEYRIEEEGVRLTGYGNRLIKNEDLVDMFQAAHLLQDFIWTFMHIEKDRFIKQGGYEEEGWRISPVVEGTTFAIRISGSSPGTSVTGRVRRDRAQDRGHKNLKS